MSDFYNNQPEMNPSYGRQGADNGEWGIPVFPAGQEDTPDGYSPLSDGADAAHDVGEDLYAAWRRPGAMNFLDDEPIPLGAEMQQGGVPLFSAEQREDGFRAMGDDAPTKIAPAVQRVSRRTTLSGDELPEAAPRANAPAVSAREPANATGDAAAPRRRSRMDRARTEAPRQPSVPESASPFDPFSAGDSEVKAAEQDRSDAERRAAVPGGRYTGARTAMPAGSVAQKAKAVRNELMERMDDGDRSAQRGKEPAYMENERSAAGNAAPVRRPMPETYNNQDARPAQRPIAPRPAAAPVRRPMPDAYGDQNARPAQRPAAPNRRPMPDTYGDQDARPARRPMPNEGRGTAERRPIPPEAANRQQPGDGFARPQPQQADANAYAYRAQQARSPYDEGSQSQRMPVKRKPYDFEMEEGNVPRRRGGALLPIVIVLLVLAGLLAAVCLPDWANMGGAIGEKVLPVKTTVLSAFATVKGMILPEEELIKSFTVSASGSTAPVTVRLMVQTSKNASGLRVADDQGNTLYSELYSDQLILTNEVVANSNVLIWQPICTIEDEYSGGFTAYVIKKDGTESEGFSCGSTVEIAAPKPALPPIQSFTVDTESSEVPVDVIFAVVTSMDVEAVRVVDQYKSPVATMSVEDMDNEQGTMTESGDVRTWTLNAEIAAAYSGSYAVQYRTADDALNFTDSEYSVNAQFIDQGAEALPGDDADVALQTGDAAVAAATSVPQTQVPTAQPTPIPTAAVQAAVTATPTSRPTSTPTPKPTAAPTLAPDSTPLPILNAQAAESAAPDQEDLSVKAVLYSNGKSVQTYNRASAIAMLSPFTTYAGGSDYATWKQAGVLTFRSGPMRQNAAYGTVEVNNMKLTEVWSQPVGSMKVSKDTLYGVNAPGQPLIVKWPTEVRQRMGILEEARNVTALKEVIVAGQDGKIYFYNLQDGTASREPIDMGAPSAGGLSVATNGTPILGVGQSHSKLASKTVKSGYHLFNLLTNKEELLVQTDGKEKFNNYSGVLGAALFDSKTGTMIFGSQGGVLYTAELGKQTDAYDFSASKVSLGNSVQGYKASVKGQDKKNTNIDASVAMYNNYVYYADQYGVVQCVNVNDLTTVWAVNTGDNVDATPALDMDDESTVALYTGNTILLRRKDGVCTLRRLNALTGEEDWSYAVPDITYDNEYEVGLEASPVVGQEAISDLVIFTVTNGKKGAKTIALNKKTGSVEWQTNFTVETYSSPVAVYNEAGDAWIVQALSDGQINLMDGRTGEVLDTLKLDATIKASPAVYRDMLVIGTTGKDKGAVYCIRID